MLFSFYGKINKFKNFVMEMSHAFDISCFLLTALQRYQCDESSEQALSYHKDVSSVTMLWANSMSRHV